MSEERIVIFDTDYLEIISQFSTINSVTRDCDACSPVAFANAHILRANSLDFSYQVSPMIVRQSVDSNYSTVLPLFSDTSSVLNQNALMFLQHFNSPKTCKTLLSEAPQSLNNSTIVSTIEQMIALGLLVPESCFRQTEVCTPELAEVSDKLAVWLHITDCCNLRCAYCYLPHSQTNMSLETGCAAVEATFRSAVAHGYQEIKLKYSGGEPLLRFDLVKELHRYARQLAEQYALKLDGVVLSNGTLLTKAMVKEMQALGLRLTISLDHLPTPCPSQEGNIHPPTSLKGGFQRMYFDGRDASGDAMRGIEVALECGLVPDISITVSGKNVAALPVLLEWVLKQDLPFSLNFYRPHASKLETGNWKLNEEHFVEGMLKAYKVIESKLPQRSLLASLADLANFAAPHLRRCSVGHSYLVFDCDGNVSKCQMQMDKPVADVLAEDPLAEIQADACGIQNVTVDEKEGCQDCQWRYWCGGGCPLESYRMTGRYDVKSPHCGIYKALYPKVLRLEGLRLLKYADKI